VGASAEAAGRLKLTEGAPCLQVERWTWRGKAPVTFARQIFPGEHYQLVEDFTPRG
jgi:GntR family histidine utilization transcriptional repressor